MKSALSLAGTLRSKWQGRRFRSSDFSAHEGLMQQLQYREKSRAWTTMLMPDQDGMPRLVEDRLRDGLEGPHDRAALVRVLFERVKDVKARMTGRMGPLPADEWYLERINGLHVKTLGQLVESGPWITREIGGDEISVDVDFADIATDPNPPLPVLVPQVDPEQTTLTPLRALMAAARPPAPAGCSEPTVLTSLSDVLPVANA
ncbi:hypothetical protein CKY47_33500 [Saccharothrix yanglingensis]|uniref:Uncharacterized protein n=1 Tax=Saccharothrix yanglingensis TaxID=659496 RepID=A0ABU0X9Q8_9PSEU|nr:hypothetical protein [Saccharothrix yanglingensis]